MKLRFRNVTIMGLLSLVAGYSLALPLPDEACPKGYSWSKLGYCVRISDGSPMASVGEQRPPPLERPRRPSPIPECPAGQVLKDKECVEPEK
jgi:hypothetical protein